MLSLASHARLELLPDHGAEIDQVRAQLWGLLSTLYSPSGAPERRGESRYPFPYLFHLHPVGDDGLTPCGPGVVVAGKHISARGLDFYHPHRLPYRRMIASLESGSGQWFGFLIDVSWCRFTRHGWYESGGRFLQCAPSPLEAANV
ncbi:MAG: hypothetical protein ABSF26_20740 [Thermoguttaceae bacterium]|jgi:hypothetical protein